MKKIFLLSALITSASHAAYIPSFQSPSGTDRFRTSQGATCEQAVATGKSFQLGLYGSNEDFKDDYTWRNYKGNDVGVYAGLQFQIGGHERVNCTHMYNLEMREMERQDKLAEAEHELRLMQIQAEKTRLKGRGSMHFRER
ncbi:hypothetical protein [Vibrio harveyi]|uniref:hypothetical protein n=1 Tax=Vibrio harveyi TaxID=669 RepID=UPI000682E07B|nr:hypothetical protein [Vibrio harveyi]